VPNDKIEMIRELIFADPNLVPGEGVIICPARAVHRQELIGLYDAALSRGDWFGSRVSDPLPQQLVAEAFVSETIQTKDIIFCVFTTQQHHVIGATALYFDDTRGFLIDDTQIDPIKGRRKGIMSSYFRRIAPILSRHSTYWTEFVLTPGSRVLRQVLISELGMIITGLRPACYTTFDGRFNRSVLIAHGGAERVRKSLGSLWFANDALFPLNVILEGSFDPSAKWPQPRTISNEAKQKPLEIWVAARALQKIRMLRESGFIPVAVEPFAKQVLLSRALLYEESLSFLAAEGIEIATRVSKYVTVRS
jgi:hypothetical protein